MPVRQKPGFISTIKSIIMKKILSLVVIVSVALTSTAQKLQEKGPLLDKFITKDTTINTDTTNTYLLAIGSGLASIDVEVKLVSGTIGGKAYLYGRTGTYYNLLDSSATFTASVPWKTWLFDKAKYTYYKDYKVEYRTTTTQTSYIIVAAMRRPDENY